MTNKRVLLGEFGRAQGIKGEVRIKSYTENPLALASYKPLTDEGGRVEYKILSARVHDRDMLVARLEGVNTREQAEALTRRKIYTPREALADNTAGEYLHADLIGLAVVLKQGAVIGAIAGIENYGAGDLLDIQLNGQSTTRLLPFTDACVPVIDMESRRVIIDPPLGWDTDDE